MSTPRVALVAGATGLVGSHLLRRLLADPAWGRVVSVGRRPSGLTHERLVEVTCELTAPTAPDDLRAALGDTPVDDVLIALGTTIKQAGSQAAFRAVDHEAVLTTARVGLEQGARTCVHVTALGADPKSRIFYNRVKGETEADVDMLGFGSTTAVRPSMLAGDRAESRRAERLGLAAMCALGPLLGGYRPVHVDVVAGAMVALARAGRAGHHVVRSGELGGLARADLGASGQR